MAAASEGAALRPQPSPASVSLEVQQLSTELEGLRASHKELQAHAKEQEALVKRWGEKREDKARNGSLTTCIGLASGSKRQCFEFYAVTVSNHCSFLLFEAAGARKVAVFEGTRSLCRYGRWCLPPGRMRGGGLSSLHSLCCHKV